ncbi:hypothetical protein CG51_06035 [Haematobacter missouriensis]|uniref:Uncharacterized protein n=1 Tax=Haematobacter missouriensis TaxID=366616 RepID=A0A212AQ25_9RHOB|nr:hypothetical protein [Haematobacter missouriensis]KFI31053.1 hypothetical protein CG51_06035 [Haematobacter missouriensis]OWJ73911.1 hypothetical protein CDV53_14375 [Haematobacter missouriensis]OWJ83553.1 hypothetical protein CDV52_11040 [Haematobacter missouriensis]
MNARPDPLALISSHASDVLSALLSPKRPRDPDYEFDFEVDADPEHLVVLKFGGDVDGEIWPVSCEIDGIADAPELLVTVFGREAYDRAIAAAEDWWDDKGWAAAERDAADNCSQMSRWDD